MFQAPFLVSERVIIDAVMVSYGAPKLMELIWYRIWGILYKVFFCILFRLTKKGFGFSVAVDFTKFNDVFLYRTCRFVGFFL